MSGHNNNFRCFWRLTLIIRYTFWCEANKSFNNTFWHFSLTQGHSWTYRKCIYVDLADSIGFESEISDRKMDGPIDWHGRSILFLQHCDTVASHLNTFNYPNSPKFVFHFSHFELLNLSPRERGGETETENRRNYGETEFVRLKVSTLHM